MTTTPRSKGKWYKPVAVDSRGSGARKRSYLALAGDQKASGGKRNVMGTGALELLGLANGVIGENIEEKQIFGTNNELRMLLENLRISENKKEKEDETQ